MHSSFRHVGSRDRYSYTLYLDLENATAQQNDTTKLITYSWPVNWNVVLGGTSYNAGSKWEVTHDFTSAHYETKDGVWDNGWMRVEGLYSAQAKFSGIPGVPLNTYVNIVHPLNAETCIAHIRSEPRSIVCGISNSSDIRITMVPMVQSQVGSPILEGGVHTLRFDLISDT